MLPPGESNTMEPLRRALQGLDSGKPLALVLRSFFSSKKRQDAHLHLRRGSWGFGAQERNAPRF